jgi:hypothetical protein
MRHRIDDQIDADNCRRDSVRAVKIHDLSRGRVTAPARALHDAPTSLLERAYKGQAQNAARPDHENKARIGSLGHQHCAVNRRSAPDKSAREVELAAGGLDARCTRTP